MLHMHHVLGDSGQGGGGKIRKVIRGATNHDDSNYGKKGSGKLRSGNGGVEL